MGLNNKDKEERYHWKHDILSSWWTWKIFASNQNPLIAWVFKAYNALNNAYIVIVVFIVIFFGVKDLVPDKYCYIDNSEY